jgi:hypothetical protein
MRLENDQKWLVGNDLTTDGRGEHKDTFHPFIWWGWEDHENSSRDIR